MEAKDFVLLVLLASGGEIRGKTKLQKTMYFVGLLTDCCESLGYRAHFYGPYSDEVADALTRLKAIQVLEESVEPWGAVDERGFEVRRYDFRLNDQGRKLAQTKAKQNPDIWARIQAGLNTLRGAGDLDYMSLSVAAKTYYMLGQRRGRATEAELAALAPRFGWSVTEQEIRNAAEYLSRLGLVEISPN